MSGQLDHIRNKPVFISASFGDMSLYSTMLPQHSVSSTLRDFELSSYMIKKISSGFGRLFAILFPPFD